MVLLHHGGETHHVPTQDGKPEFSIGLGMLDHALRGVGLGVALHSLSKFSFFSPRVGVLLATWKEDVACVPGVARCGHRLTVYWIKFEIIQLIDMKICDLYFSFTNYDGFNGGCFNIII